jgi:hypothetical protein
MSIYKKLQEARILLQNTKLNKSGKNKFAGYEYFELGDFLPQIQVICQNIGLCGVVSFDQTMAYLTIYDVDGTDKGFLTFTSPMSSAALKGCHDVQNLGAVQTYLRRYLWTNAFEIVEHDALDATTGSVEPAKKPVSETINVPIGTAKVTVTKPPITGQKGEWQIVAPAKPEGDVDDWLKLIQTSSHMLLDLATNEEDVMQIFKKNKVLFDTVKATDATFFKEMMGKFTAKKNEFTTEEA